MVLKINFSDFWPGFNYSDFIVYKILKKYYEIEISETPDYLIFSDYSVNHLKYDCVKIRYSAENVRPDFKLADFHIGFDYSDSPNYLRLPLYVSYFDEEYTLGRLVKTKSASDIEQIINEKQKFCCILSSNDDATRRINFFKKLSKYKKVDSGGMVLNNIGYRVENKLAFVSEYKFNIAFENESYPGYTTEKVLQPFHVNTIPIYWGSEKVYEEFNTKAFLNWHDYGDDESLIEKIIEVDEDEAIYKAYLQECLLYDRQASLYFSELRVSNFFEKVFKLTSTSVDSNYRYINSVQKTISTKLQAALYRFRTKSK